MTGEPLPEMPCQEFVECLTDYLEGALTDVDRTRLEEHLAECDECALYLDQLRTTRELTGRLQDDDVTPAMRDGLMAAFNRWKDESQPGGSAAHDPVPEPGGG